MHKPADLEDRLIDFAVRIITVVEALPSSKAGNHVSTYFLLHKSTINNHQSNPAPIGEMEPTS
jgi:hypothetical protein